MKIEKILLAGVGGMIGSVLRYLVSAAAAKCLGDFPLGTLIVNVAGGFLMGFLMEGSAGMWSISDETRVFLTTGILGGFTTFSTFSYETVSLLSEGRLLLGGLNAGLNLFLSLFACFLGRSCIRVLRGAPIF